jgi:hypothetical protein
MTVATQAHQHVARDLPDALAVVRAHGLRLTGARRLVLEALFAVDRPRWSGCSASPSWSFRRR